MSTAIVHPDLVAWDHKGETEGCGQGQTDWADLILTGKPAGRCVSGGSMYFANGSLGGRAPQFTHDSKTTSRFMVAKFGDLDVDVLQV